MIRVASCAPPDLVVAELPRDARRTEEPDLPVVVVSGRGSEVERVRGFARGADDYVVKPFSYPELLARVQAVLRRSNGRRLRGRIRVGELEVDPVARRATVGGRVLVLTAKEFSLLDVLLLHQGAVVDRATITAHVWDANHDPFTNALEVLVRRLRAKIDDPFEPRLIHTVRGAGYRFGP